MSLANSVAVLRRSRRLVPGLDQVNLRVPCDFILHADGKSANPIDMSIQ